MSRVLVPNIEREDDRLPVLILDRHRSHDDVSGLLSDNFEVLRTPPQVSLVDELTDDFPFSLPSSMLQLKQLGRW